MDFVRSYFGTNELMHNGGLITRGGSGIILWTYSNINSVTL